MDTNQNPVYQQPASPVLKAIDMGGDGKTTVIEAPTSPQVPTIPERKAEIQKQAKAAPAWDKPVVIRRPSRVKFDSLGREVPNPTAAAPIGDKPPAVNVATPAAEIGKTGTPPAEPETPTGIEPPAPVAKAKPDEREIYARSMADLARQDRKLRETQADIKRQRDELDARLQKVKDLEAFAEELASDPLGALQKKGLSYDDLTQRIWNKNQATPDQKIKALEQRIEGLMQKLEERDAGQRQVTLQTAVQNAQNAAKNIVEAAAEKFPYLTFTQDFDGVVNTIAAHYQETGEQLTLRQACDRLESEYAAQDQNLRAHLGRRGAQQPQRQPGNSEPEPNPAGEPKKVSTTTAPNGQPQTLTSQQVAQVASNVRPAKFRSESERIAWATRAWK